MCRCIFDYRLPREFPVDLRTMLLEQILGPLGVSNRQVLACIAVPLLPPSEEYRGGKRKP